MALDKALLIEMLRRMVRLRLFEEEVIRLVERGEIVGAAQYDAGHRYSLTLIGPMKRSIDGLSTQEKGLGQLQALLDRSQAELAGFAASLLPASTPA